MYDTWERFKDLLRKCPNHGIPPWVQIQTFYNDLNGQTKSIVDAAASESLMTKTYEEAYELMEKLSSNHYQMDNDRTSRRQGGVLELDALTTLSTQVATLTKQVQNMGMQLISVQFIVLHRNVIGVEKLILWINAHQIQSLPIILGISIGVKITLILIRTIQVGATILILVGVATKVFQQALAQFNH